MKLKENKSKGFTLVELIVVLLIIGILSGVTLRAIDLTRERSMFTDTTKKLNELGKAITGNSDLIAEGRRVDFGFIGDMGRLPLSLDELIKNTTNDINWHGPYIKIDFLEDTVNPNFKRDAWGNEIEYSSELATLTSLANGRQTMTYILTDSITFLTQNRVSGIITDNENNPPGEFDSLITITIELPGGDSVTQPNYSGYYQVGGIPIGKHKITVTRGTASPEILVKWVSVVPKSNTLVDFKFTSSFRSKLQYVEKSALTLPDSASVQFSVFNTSGEVVNLTSLRFMIIDTPQDTFVFCETIIATGRVPPNHLWDWGEVKRIGVGREAQFIPPALEIAPRSVASFGLLHFRIDSIASAPSFPMHRRFIELFFSDGSLIRFLPERPESIMTLMHYTPRERSNSGF